MTHARKIFQVLEKIFLHLLVLLLPTQLALHFWPDWSLVAGIRVDYLAPTVFLTDIFIFGLLITSFLGGSFNLKRKSILALGGLLLFAVINTSIATNYPAAILKWVKILELAFFFLYLIGSRREETKKAVVRVLPFSILLFAFIGFGQVLLQRTIGGFLYFLGERNFTSLTPGIALYNLFGTVLLRPYSTFPHPNVFGAFMFVGTYLLGVLKTKKSGLDYLTMVTGFIGTILSGSLAVYFGMSVVGVLILLRQVPQSFFKLVTLTAIVLSLGFLFIAPQISTLNLAETAAKRVSLASAAGAMITESPLLGIGADNFIVNLPRYAAKDSALWFLQPVHNIFLLIFVETGIIGLLLFGFLLQKILSKMSPLNLAMVFVILTGLFDHYWLTLQQPQILLTLLLGLMW